MGMVLIGIAVLALAYLLAHGLRSSGGGGVTVEPLNITPTTDPPTPGGPETFAYAMSDVEIAARERAARIQEAIGFGTVAASTSNDWKGAYAIVDFDTLERLLRERASLHETIHEIEMQATRRHRASDLKRYLETDLAIIERKCSDVWKRGG